MIASLITPSLPSPGKIIAYTAVLVIGEWMAIRGIRTTSGKVSGAAFFMVITFSLALLVFCGECVDYMIRIRFEVDHIYWFWQRHVFN